MLVHSGKRCTTDEVMPLKVVNIKEARRAMWKRKCREMQAEMPSKPTGVLISQV